MAIRPTYLNINSLMNLAIALWCVCTCKAAPIAQLLRVAQPTFYGMARTGHWWVTLFVDTRPGGF